MFLLLKPYFVQLLKPEVFEFIEKHNLHDAIHDKVRCKDSQLDDKIITSI